MPESRRRTGGERDVQRGHADETKRELEKAGKLTPEDERVLEKEGTGTMTVEEAGHLGGEIGGQKVKRLIEEGKELERRSGRE